MAEQLSVLIIGAGTKGAFGPVSHAEAFKKAGFKILGFYDTNREKAVQAAEKWGGEAYYNWGHVCRNETPDVISVAVSDDQHAAVLDEIGHKPFRFLFAEKPFGQSAILARNYAEVFKERKIPVMVNYTRRFFITNGFIRELEFGAFLGGSGFYGKGLYHNGSHLLDTLAMLLGDVESVKALDKVYDGDPADPSVSAVLVYQGKPVYIGVIPRTCINAFEATLYFKKGAIRLTDCGRKIEICNAISRADLPTEYIYEEDGEEFYQNPAKTPMDVAVQNIADHLNHGTPLLSPVENAIRVLEICEALS
jgi:predicted dehydrogenase